MKKPNKPLPLLNPYHGMEFDEEEELIDTTYHYKVTIGNDTDEAIMFIELPEIYNQETETKILESQFDAEEFGMDVLSVEFLGEG